MILISVPATVASTTLIASKFVTAVRTAPVASPVAVRFSVSVPVPPVSVVPESISSSRELTVNVTFALLITSSTLLSPSSAAKPNVTVVSADHLPAVKVNVLFPVDDRSNVVAPPRSPFAVMSIALRGLITSILLTPPNTVELVTPVLIVSVSVPSPPSIVSSSLRSLSTAIVSLPAPPDILSIPSPNVIESLPAPP